MDSLRAELQNDFQSQVDQLKIESSQLKEKVAQLEGEASRGEAEKSELKQRCDTLHHTNAMLLKRQLKGEEEISQLKEKLDSLQTSFDRAERKAKYLEVVRKNQQWEYPLAVPTTSELVSDGYDEDLSEEIIRHIDYIKNLTKQMRKGESIEVIDVIDFDAESHQYYEGMLPHYRQFANALMEYKHTIDYMEDDKFHFVMGWEITQVPAQALLYLQRALQHTHIHQLQFHPIQTDVFNYLEFISNCVRENTRLEEFSLYDITVENSRDVDLLCEALNNKESLQEIEITFCGTEGGVFREIFNKLRTEHVKMIDLSDNDFSNLRPTDMSEFLSSNPSLKQLYLRHNLFNEQDVNLLESAIFDSTSLNTAYDSNHHCQLFLDGTISKIEEFNYHIDTKLNMKEKIYTLLSKRNRRRENAGFFEQDGIGIKHIPQILSLLKPFSLACHKQEVEVKPLSIAYEIMRDWRMPELYNLDQMDVD
eukprot:scaffold9209_cov22-Cyclotella_meneghiniana.AAC.1